MWLLGALKAAWMYDGWREDMKVIGGRRLAVAAIMTGVVLWNTNAQAGPDETIIRIHKGDLYINPVCQDGTKVRISGYYPILVASGKGNKPYESIIKESENGVNVNFTLYISYIKENKNRVSPIYYKYNKSKKIGEYRIWCKGNISGHKIYQYHKNSIINLPNISIDDPVYNEIINEKISNAIYNDNEKLIQFISGEPFFKHTFSNKTRLNDLLKLYFSKKGNRADFLGGPNYPINFVYVSEPPSRQARAAAVPHAAPIAAPPGFGEGMMDGHRLSPAPGVSQPRLRGAAESPPPGQPYSVPMQADPAPAPEPSSYPRYFIHFTNRGFHSVDMREYIQAPSCRRIEWIADDGPGRYALVGCQDTKVKLTFKNTPLLPLKLRFSADEDLQEISAEKLRNRQVRLSYPESWGVNGSYRLQKGKLSDNLHEEIRLNVKNDCSLNYALQVRDILEKKLHAFKPQCLSPREIEFVLEGYSRLQKYNPQISFDLCNEAPIILNRRGEGTCSLKNSGGQGTLTLKMKGFEPLREALEISGDTDLVKLPYGITAKLRPEWPFANPLVNGNVPRYVADSVTYSLGNKRDCQNSQLALDNNHLPTLREAGCPQGKMPSAIRVRFARKKAPRGVPEEAFRPHYEHAVHVGESGIQLPMEKLKRHLPAGLQPSAYNHFREQFGEITGLSVVFYPNENCSGRELKTISASLLGGDKDKFTWPLSAKIMDNTSAFLSFCAPAHVIVEESPDLDFFTFDFKPARARGKRNIILISKSRAWTMRGRSRALQTALETLAKRLKKNYEDTGRLVPVDVSRIDQQQRMLPLFTGEEVVEKLPDILRKLGDLGTDGPGTVPMALLLNNPNMDLKKDIQSITMIMQGARYDYQIENLVLRLGAKHIRLLLMSECSKWTDQSALREIYCQNLAGMPSDKVRKILMRVFTEVAFPNMSGGVRR